MAIAITSVFQAAQTARPPLSRLSRLLLRARRCENGATAIEFGILFLPFVMLMMALLEFGFQIFVASNFDNALRDEARRMQVGVSQAEGLSREQFRQRVCDRLAFPIDCARVGVDVRTMTSWASVLETWSMNGGSYRVLQPPSFNQDQNTFCMGTDNTIVLVRGAVEIPVFAGLWLPKRIPVGDSSVSAMVSNHLFRVEPYGATNPGGCA